MLLGELPLDDDVRVHEPAAGVVEESAQNRAGAGERQIRDDGERLRGPRPSPGVGQYDSYGASVEAAPENGRERRIRFERRDRRAGVGEGCT